MVDYVLESNPALERLIERLGASGETEADTPSTEEGARSNGRAQRSGRQRWRKAHPFDPVVPREASTADMPKTAPGEIATVTEHAGHLEDEQGVEQGGGQDEPTAILEHSQPTEDLVLVGFHEDPEIFDEDPQDEDEIDDEDDEIIDIYGLEEPDDDDEPVDEIDQDDEILDLYGLENGDDDDEPVDAIDEDVRAETDAQVEEEAADDDADDLPVEAIGTFEDADAEVDDDECDVADGYDVEELEDDDESRIVDAYDLEYLDDDDQSFDEGAVVVDEDEEDDEVSGADIGVFDDEDEDYDDEADVAGAYDLEEPEDNDEGDVVDDYDLEQLDDDDDDAFDEGAVVVDEDEEDDEVSGAVIGVFDDEDEDYDDEADVAGAYELEEMEDEEEWEEWVDGEESLDERGALLDEVADDPDENGHLVSDWIFEAFENWKRLAVDDDAWCEEGDRRALDDLDQVQEPPHDRSEFQLAVELPAEQPDANDLELTDLWFQLSVNARPKKARHKRQSPRQRERLWKKAVREVQKAEKSSMKAAATSLKKTGLPTLSRDDHLVESNSVPSR